MMKNGPCANGMEYEVQSIIKQKSKKADETGSLFEKINLFSFS